MPWRTHVAGACSSSSPGGRLERAWRPSSNRRRMPTARQAGRLPSKRRRLPSRRGACQPGEALANRARCLPTRRGARQPGEVLANQARRLPTKPGACQPSQALAKQAVPRSQALAWHVAEVGRAGCRSCRSMRRHGRSCCRGRHDGRARRYRKGALESLRRAVSLCRKRRTPDQPPISAGVARTPDKNRCRIPSPARVSACTRTVANDRRIPS